MSYTKAWNFKDKNYIFKLTRKAQIAVEERMDSRRRKLLSNEDALKYLEQMEQLEVESQKINAMPEGKEKEKAVKKFNEKNAGLVKFMSENDDLTKDPIDLYELGYILLTSYPKNPHITREEYEDLCCDIEDQLGLEETINMFVEMKEKVFHEMECINKVLNTPKTHTN
jgi:hypothetical protein